MDNWYAWVVMQSLDTQTLFSLAQTVKVTIDEPTKKEVILLVTEDSLDLVMDLLRTHLQPGWFAHLIKQNRIKIVFKDRVFDLLSGDDDKEVTDYARAMNVSNQSLVVNELFDQAREEGFIE